MKLIPHLILALFLVYMFSNQVKLYKTQNTLQAKAKFQHFSIGFIVFIIVLIWSWI